VREVYEVDPEHLLLVASDRVSAFDVVMAEPIPRKGAVLTQVSAFWFELLHGVLPSHYVTAATDRILDRIPDLIPHRAEVAGRTMLVRRTHPIPFECVVRGYLSGSAWAVYRRLGTLARSTAGLVEERDSIADFQPAAKADRPRWFVPWCGR
jgi:phosphoribosylaminoimidazole-succinocarboxamide synthase